VIVEPGHPGGQTKPLMVASVFPYVQMIRTYGAGYEIRWVDALRAHPTIGKDHSQKPTRWRVNGQEHRPTTAELQACGGFPLPYQFGGNANDAWNRIGNSVPPLMMRAIGRHLRRLPPNPLTMSTYKETLDAAWAEHLAPRTADAPTVISTFAGGGGSSLGYSMAGFREVLAVEWDDNAAATFRLNFPHVPLYHGDIAKLSVEEALRISGLEPGELDVFDGSPPCQGFSTAGKREFGDKRNQLFKEYVRLLRGLRPKVFVMENVSGMVKGDMKLMFAEILRELKASGYAVKARLLNAMYFGVHAVSPCRLPPPASPLRDAR
jgi:site-specific DNA-cytosine methylase